MSTLQTLTPNEAISLYLDARSGECSQQTLQSHRYRLEHFQRWCKKEEIENLNNLAGRDLHRYRIWRRDDGGLNKVSLRTQLSTLRVFLKFCERVDGVEMDLYEKVPVPTLDKGEDARDKKLAPGEAMDILEHLRKYQYASKEHAAFELFWHTGMRIGELRALDLDDYNSRDAYLEVKHRPRGGTPIKNKDDGERPVGLTAEIAGLLDDYIESVRFDVIDKNARTPLLTTRQGRPAKSTIRTWVYVMTQPCSYSGSCPVGNDPEECPAASYADASECPENVNPHAIRRGSITYHLLREWPKEDVSERMNVDSDVLDDHYDRRTDKEKLDQRRQNLSKL